MILIDVFAFQDPGSGAPCEAIVGFSSLQECHRVILAESVCHPRKAVYLSFLLLAPVLILAFAYV